MSPISVIAASSVVLALLLVIALYKVKSGNAYANRILALFIGLSALYLASLAPLHSRMLGDYSLVRLASNIVFLFGPLLYTYVKAMTMPGFRLGKFDTLHAVPFISLLFLGLVPVLQGQINQGYIDGVLDQSSGSNVVGYIGIAYYGLLTLYAVLCVNCLRQYRLSLPSKFSSLEGINLRWLYILILITLVIASLGLIIAIARVFSDIQFWPRGIFSMSLMITIYYLIAFMGITQPRIFSEVSSDLPTTKTSEKHSAQYLTSSLSPEEASHYWTILCNYMEEDKPYLKNELRIADLADMLNLPSNHLSQTINQQAGQNFHDFVNGFRVTEAQRILNAPTSSDLTIVQVAFESGFNSQSAFYKHFKNALGVTPAQYRKNK